MKTRFFLLGGAILGLGGCCNLAQVYDTSGNKLPGIPFYIVKGAIEQKTIYASPYYHVTVSIDTLVSAGPSPEVKPPQKAGKSSGNTLAPDNTITPGEHKATTVHLIDVENELSRDRYAILKKFVFDHQQKLVQGDMDYGEVIAVLGSTTFDPYAEGREAETLLVANTLTPTKYVEYNHVYYYNVEKPFIGSTEMTAELAADGTLSKMSGKVEDKSIETIVGGLTSVLPVKEYLTYKWTGAAPATKLHVNAPQYPRTIVTIKSESRQITYTLVRLHKDTLTGFSPIEIEERDSPDVSYTRTIDAANAKSDDSKDKRTNIDISGKVSIPKDAATAPPTK